MTYQQIFDVDHFSNNLGIEIIGIEDGKSKTRLKIQDYFYNPIGSIHGGVLFSLADVTAGYLANSYGNVTTTLSANFNYLSPALRPTVELVAYGKEIKRGKTISIYDVEIFDEKERKIASGTFTFYSMNKKHEDNQSNGHYKNLQK